VPVRPRRPLEISPAFIVGPGWPYGLGRRSFGWRRFCNWVTSADRSGLVGRQSEPGSNPWPFTATIRSDSRTRRLGALPHMLAKAPGPVSGSREVRLFVV
jgi:hypothetical protein